MNGLRIHRIGRIVVAVVLSVAMMRLAMFFSPEFRLSVYRFRDYVIMERFFPIATKFWVHRCNDSRKMEEAMAKYAGVELDIIFYPTAEGGVFETSHDPQATIEHPLDEFFAVLALSQETKIWLDFKNLDKTTVQPAYQAMERLRRIYHIDMKRLIVESGNYDCLGAFHRQGYYTSYTNLR